MEKDNNHSISKLVKEQILEIRDSGLTNMLDLKVVQRLANESDFYELVCLIEDHPSQYIKFIISGDEKLLPN